MRILVIAMAVSVVVLVLWQFLAKKGDWAHVIRYVVICLLSVAIVVLNTIYLPVKWDRAFLFHIAVGSVYFSGLIAIGISGWLLKRQRIYRRAHRWLVGLTVFFLLLTSLVPRLLR